MINHHVRASTRLKHLDYLFGRFLAGNVVHSPCAMATRQWGAGSTMKKPLPAVRAVIADPPGEPPMLTVYVCSVE